jgi:TRAP transporter TAXI family solute receptor
MRGRGCLAAAAVAALVALVVACSPNDPPGGENRLSIATGGSGGVYQVYGSALADLLSDELEDRQTTAETTSASVDNLLLVAGGESDLAFTLADTAIDAVEGRAGFDAPLPLRALAKLYPNVTQVVVPARSGIERIEDLRGRTVSIGAPNSGTEVIALRLLRAAGLDPEEDVDGRGLGVGESVAALRDGTIEAFFWSGGVPTGAITDLATTDDVRLLDLEAYVDDLRGEYGEAYEPTRTEEGDYTGVPPVTTIAVPNLLMVRADMDDALAAQITRTIFRGKPRLAEVTPQAELLDPAESSQVTPPVRLHRAAEHVYAEAAASA